MFSQKCEMRKGAKYQVRETMTVAMRESEDEDEVPFNASARLPKVGVV